MRPEQITCRNFALELPFWLSRRCYRVRRWREAVVATVAAVMAGADTAAEVISVGVMAAAMALAACILAVVTTPVRGSPSHIHFLEGAFTAAVLLPVKAGGTSARSETHRCDPLASAAQ
jgi:hypothetical protein